MEKTAVVLGIFVREEALHGALSQLREQDHGWRVLEVYSPVPSHRIEKTLMPEQSTVRVFTLTGGAVGAVGGTLLAIWSSLKWSLITGGKPIISVPPFAIVGFELTLLLGALATVVGLLINARLVCFRKDAYYDPRFSEDHFGLLISGPPQEQMGIADFLKNASAKEVRIVDQT